MKNVTLVFTLLLLPPAVATAQTMNDTALAEIFTDVYDEPYVDAFPTEIPDLAVAQVFEVENAAEDPLSTDCWLVTSLNEKHLCTFEGAQEAFTTLAFNPSSEEDALAVANVLSYTVFNGSIVDDPSHWRLTGVPSEASSVVTSPSVELLDAIYAVDFYTYYEDSDAHWFDEDAYASLTYLVVEVGLNHLVLVTNERTWAGQIPYGE